MNANTLLGGKCEEIQKEFQVDNVFKFFLFQ
jgi:hypothetical protein